MSPEFDDSVVAFIEYMRSLPGADPMLTIDRIDPNKGYERGNLRWATREQQSRNLRAVIRVGDEAARDLADREFPQLSSEYVAKCAAVGGLDDLRDRVKAAEIYGVRAIRKNATYILYENKYYTAKKFSQKFGVFDDGKVIRLTRMGLSPGDILRLATKLRGVFLRRGQLWAEASVLLSNPSAL